MMKKGFVYTMFTIVAVSSIFLVLALNMDKTSTHTTKIIEKIRADEVHYLVEGIEKDIKRSGEISGRRALLALINWEISNGEFVNVANESVKEAIINGTINNGNENLTLMENNTISDWMQTLETLAKKRGLKTTILIPNTTVSMESPYTLRVSTNAHIQAQDEIIEVSYKRNTTYSNIVSVDNLEDPFITVKSYGYAKQNFIECEKITGIANSGDWVYGFAYITDENNLLNVTDKADKVLITGTVAGKSNFNGFAGIVTEQNDAPTAPPYVFNVTNAKNIILNNSIMVIDNETVWLTNITTQPNASCYFNKRDAPSFLSRLEGKNNTDNDLGIAAFIHVPSLPVEMQSGSDTSVIGYEYFEGLFD